MNHKGLTVVVVVVVCVLLIEFVSLKPKLFNDKVLWQGLEVMMEWDDDEVVLGLGQEEGLSMGAEPR